MKHCAYFSRKFGSLLAKPTQQRVSSHGPLHIVDRGPQQGAQVLLSARDFMAGKDRCCTLTQGAVHWQRFGLENVESDTAQMC